MRQIVTQFAKKKINKIVVSHFREPTSPPIIVTNHHNSPKNLKLSLFQDGLYDRKRPKTFS